MEKYNQLATNKVDMIENKMMMYPVRWCPKMYHVSRLIQYRTQCHGQWVIQ